MAETYAHFAEISEIAQSITRSFARVGSTFQGQMTYRDPTTMTVGGHYSQIKASDLTGSEEVLYSLGQAKNKAKTGSLKRHGFDAEIDSIITAFKQGNEAISDIGAFLTRLVEHYEMCEAKLMTKLGDTGMLSKEEKAWAEDILDPIGGYTDERRGLLFAAVGLAKLNTLLATGEDGTVGIDACLVDAKTKRTTRNADGDRVTDVTQFKVLCFMAKAGVGEHSGGETYGFDVGVNLMSGGSWQEGGNKPSLGLGLEMAYMTTYNDDGTKDTSISIPIKAPKSAPQFLKVLENLPLPGGTMHGQQVVSQDPAVQRFAHVRGF